MLYVLIHPFLFSIQTIILIQSIKSLIFLQAKAILSKKACLSNYRMWLCSFLDWRGSALQPD